MSRLRAVHFVPGISVTVGGKYPALSFWDRSKHPELACERQPNGDLAISWREGVPDRIVRTVKAIAIAWEMADPPEVTKPEVKK